MQIRSRQDFWSGVMFCVLGAMFAILATRYSMGTADRMGPGYFPFWLGVILAGLGVVITLGALSPRAEETTIDRFNWRVIGLLIGSVVLYAALLNPLGVYLATFVLVVSSSYASHEFSLKVAVLNGIALVLFSYAAFVKGLGLVFPLWPSFLS